MNEELKTRIKDAESAKEKLKELGGKFDRELHVKDTYFKTPSDEVLKITEDDSGSYLVELHKREGKFQIVRYEEIENAGEIKGNLREKYGIKCVLNKKRVFYEFDDFKVNLNLIEGVGDFLVVECENPTEEIIEETLGFENPEYITVPYIKSVLPTWHILASSISLCSLPQTSHLQVTSFSTMVAS